MSVHIIWKRLRKNDAPLSLAISLLRPLASNAKPHFKFPNFCTQIATPSITLPDRRVVTEFFISKCGLTNEDIAKAFRHCDSYLHAKSTQNLEEVLELLNGCGLTTPAQIRKVVVCNPHFFFRNSERNVKSKLSLLRTFMKEEHITKLVCHNARIINLTENKLRSKISLLQKLGVEGQALSEILACHPRLLTISEEKVMESFKQAEDLGFKKGSKMFIIAMCSVMGFGKEKLNRKLQYLSSLGFSEQQLSDILRRKPSTLGLSEEKLKSNVDYVVKILGLPLADLVKYPHLFGHSLETRIIPRYRVMEALKSMQVQGLKKKKTSFPQIANLTEKRFLEKFVNSNAESSFLQEIYHRGKLEF